MISLERKGLAGWKAHRARNQGKWFVEVLYLLCEKARQIEATVLHTHIALISVFIVLCSYSTWTCSDGEVCLGVAVKAVLYNKNVDYTSTAETTETFSSSILQLNLGDPNSGKYYN